jgi:hypothetical protein
LNDGLRLILRIPAALDNGQRWARTQLAAVVRRLLYALRWSR